MKESGFVPILEKRGTFLNLAFLEHSILNTSPEVYKLVMHYLKNVIMLTNLRINWFVFKMVL